MVEPWLRGTHAEIDALRRQVVHALELTSEDVVRWCSSLTQEELYARPFHLPSVAFEMRHILGSLDRLLTYAEDRPLNQAQLNALRAEHDPSLSAALLTEFNSGLTQACTRILALNPDEYELIRHVGRDRLPTTLGGLIIHCAEHTQRHSGQMVTTAKLIAAIRSTPTG